MCHFFHRSKNMKKKKKVSFSVHSGYCTFGSNGSSQYHFLLITIMICPTVLNKIVPESQFPSFVVAVPLS